MKDILAEIIAHKRLEIAQAQEYLPRHQLYRRVETQMDHCPHLPSMAQAVCRGTGIIAEFKRRSPSKGWIHEDGRPDRIPLGYQHHGAAAVSILTDEAYFGGRDKHIRIARESGVTLPILYKNFVVDEYQLFQARLCGASAVLLIAAALPQTTYRTLLRQARQLGLEVLLEMHTEAELVYADELPDLCGINNRHLGTFQTDIRTSFLLGAQLPPEAIKVSESGISSPENIQLLKHDGFQGFLIGETFMKETHPEEALRAFILQCEAL